MLDREALVAPDQERERRVDRRGPSAGQVVEFEASAVLVEESRQGLRRQLADLWVGAEGEPGLGHALEAAERPVGHPRQDLREGPLREAPQRLLLLLVVLPHLLRLQTEESVRFGSIDCWIEDWKKEEEGKNRANYLRRFLGGGERRRGMGMGRSVLVADSAVGCQRSGMPSSPWRHPRLAAARRG